MFIKNFLNSTREKAEDALSETKEKVDTTLEETKDKISKLSNSANKFISDGNNQMKVITVTMVAVGITMVLSNIVSIFTNISTAKHTKDSRVITNVYIYKGDKLDGIIK